MTYTLYFRKDFQVLFDKLELEIENSFEVKFSQGKAMAVQYVKNGEGENTGVFIPIEEWNSILELLKSVSSQEFQPQEWQIEVVNERLEKYLTGKSKPMDFYESMDDVEKGLK